MYGVKVKINETSLRKALEMLYRRAEGWQPIGSGECQLYARHDNEGNVYKLWIEDFAGHSTYVVGENIVPVAAQSWFDIFEHEDEREFLKYELEGDRKLMERFQTYLEAQENELLMEYDKKSWEVVAAFQRFDPEKWEQFREEWRENLFNEYLFGWIESCLERLRKSGWDISDEYSPIKE